MSKTAGYLLACVLTALPVFGQTLTISTQQLSLRMPDGGPLPPVSRFNVTSTRTWRATISSQDVASISPTQGPGSATIVVTPVSWRRPGTYTATITIAEDQGATATVTVTLTVIERATTRFTYPSPTGPVGCADVPELPPGNAAVCTVPNENPPGNFTPPGLGETYADPNFGGRVRVIGAPDSFHGYSTPSPVSANTRYALAGIRNEATLIEPQTGKAVKKVPIGIEGVMWDGRNDNFAYYTSGATLRRLDVASGQSTVVADYSGAPHQFTAITTGGTGDITKDNWLAFAAKQQNQICALDLTAVKTYCGTVPAGVVVDFPTMAKGVDRSSGQRYVLLIGGNPFLVYSVNMAQNRLDLSSRGPENIAMSGGNRDGVCDAGEPCINGSHSDTMEDSAGNQLLVLGYEEQTPCSFSIYTVQLNKGGSMGIPVELGGGLKRVLRAFRCGNLDQWVDFHIGCAKAAPVCAISTTSSLFNQTRDPADRTPVKQTAYFGEIMLLRDNGAEIRRLAKHRSLQFRNEEANGYWSIPKAAISPDGAYVIATSNFGYPNQRRVIAIDTGLAYPRLRVENPVLNAASFEPRLAPGVFATAFGINLTTCAVQIAPAFPLPTSLCGTTVKVGDADARIYSVTPEQVSFFLPQILPANRAATLSVQTTLPDSTVVTSTGTIPAESVLPSAPALFTSASATDALVLDATGTPRALRAGEVGIAFAVGLGATNPAVGEGQPSPMTEPLARLAAPADLWINDVRQKILYAGLLPGMWGVYQLNFEIEPVTAVLPEGNRIWLSVAGTETPRLLIGLLPPA